MLSTPRPVEGNLPVNAVRATALPFTRNKSSVPSIKIESKGPYSNPRNAITLFLFWESTLFLFVAKSSYDSEFPSWRLRHQRRSLFCSGSQSDGSSSSTEQCSVSETVEADSVTRADLRNFFTSVCLKASFMDKVKVLLSNFTAFFKLENQHLGSREGNNR